MSGGSSCVTVAGRPRVSWCLETVRRLEEITEIIVALPAESIAEAIGQLPGASRTISGCIGHTYWAGAASGASSVWSEDTDGFKNAMGLAVNRSRQR